MVMRRMQTFHPTRTDGGYASEDKAPLPLAGMG